MGLENSFRGIGRFTKDPELRHTQQGTAVCTVNIAMNEAWTDNDGNKQEIATFIPHVFWGKRAETVEKYCHKGSLVATEGPLRTRSYDQDEITRYVTECRVNFIKFLDPAPKQNAPDQGEVTKDGTVVGEQEPITIPEDDIPF